MEQEIILHILTKDLKKSKLNKKKWVYEELIASILKQIFEKL